MDSGQVLGQQHFNPMFSFEQTCIITLMSILDRSKPLWRFVWLLTHLPPAVKMHGGLIFDLYVCHATVLLLFGPLLNRTVCNCVNLGSLNVDSVTATETMRHS